MVCEKVGLTVATNLARLFVSLKTTDFDRPAIFISHPCICQVQCRSRYFMLKARSKVGITLCQNDACLQAALR